MKVSSPFVVLRVALVYFVASCNLSAFTAQFLQCRPSGGWRSLGTSWLAFPCVFVFGKGGPFLLLLSTVDESRSTRRMVWVFLSVS
jgi:hypothetical protein